MKEYDVKGILDKKERIRLYVDCRETLARGFLGKKELLVSRTNIIDLTTKEKNIASSKNLHVHSTRLMLLELNFKTGIKEWIEYATL